MFLSNKANEASWRWPLSCDFWPWGCYATLKVRGWGCWVHRYQNLASILSLVPKDDYLLRFVGNLYASVNLENCYLLLDIVTAMNRWARSNWPEGNGDGERLQSSRNKKSMSSFEFGSAVVRKAHQYKWVEGLQFINAIRQRFSPACERTKVERICHALGR